MSCVPKPQFNEKIPAHLTKKACLEAGLPLKASQAPKSPIKKCKKCLHHCSESNKAISISFRDNSNGNLSIIYDSSNEKSYLEQCFYDINLIGEGSFGVVFRVRSKEDQQLYAVKKSKSPFHNNTDRKTKLDEVRKHESIPKHPNCVALHSAWVEDNFLYLQMELCDTSLEHYASKNHNISVDTLWNILADMLLALKNLHDNNLIHLDVKLENILMCADETYKLADFGLVSDVNKIKSDTLEGDQKYLAPELLSGKFTKAADIFSLGIAMLELACDLLLPTNGILWQQLRNNTFPELCTEKIPHDLMEIIKKMMSSNYEERPTVDELMNHERIQKLLSERSVSSCQVRVVVRDEVEQISSNNNSRENEVTCVNSTPNTKLHHSTHWKMNVEISPIQQSHLELEPHLSWDGRWVTKRRPMEDDIQKNTANYLLSTPCSRISKKSRITAETSTHHVGRKLF